jgi:beta-phosphoglucomutase family hydrolase
LSSDLALIFDLDGVIVDSNPVHLEAWRTYLQRCGVSDVDGLPERMYGRRNDEIVRALFGSHLTPEQVSQHGAAKEALYRDLMRPQLRERLVPGVEQFVRRRRGMPMAVATNAEPANARFVLEETGLAERFSVVLDGDQVERPKPDPEIYLRAAALLGVDPSRCIVFEDSAAGVRAALAAGARVVAITTTHPTLAGTSLSVRDFLSPELEPWLEDQRAGS